MRACTLSPVPSCLRLVVGLWVATSVACGGGGGSSTTTLHVAGAFQKGPFVLGSTVSVSALDPTSFAPTGQVFNATTVNDRGEFDLTLLGPGDGMFAAVQGSGFYYNEVTGALSAAPIALRAFARVDASGTQEIYVNLVTHLTYNRVQRLLTDPAALDPAHRTGDDFVDAIAQAERELRAALAVGPSGFDPAVSGTAMNILGDPASAANAYLLTVSAVIAQAAAIRAEGGPVDAPLQEVVNTVALDLADDGQLGDAALADLIQQAEATVDARAVVAALEARLRLLGVADPVVPDVDAVLDSNNDGVANAVDHFPCGDGAPHPDVLCLRAGTGAAQGLEWHRAVYLDVDGDGDLDAFSAGYAPRLFFGDGAGGFNPGPGEIGELDAAPTAVVDLDGDGDEDVIGVTATGAVVVYPSLGATAAPFFGDAVTFGVRAGVETRRAIARDVDGDARLDLVTCERGPDLPAGGHPDDCDRVGVFLADGAGGFGVAGSPNATFPAPDPGHVVVGFDVGDVTGDGDADLVLSTGARIDSNLQHGGLTIHAGDGDGGFATPGVVLTPALGVAQPIEALAIADLDGDGALDVALGREGVGVAFLVNDGAGDFTGFPLEGITVSRWSGPPRLSLFDHDADGFIDLLAIDADGAALRVHRFGPQGFDAAETVDVALDFDGQVFPTLLNLRVADLDGDGVPDFIGDDGVLVADP